MQFPGEMISLSELPSRSAGKGLDRVSSGVIATGEFGLMPCRSYFQSRVLSAKCFGKWVWKLVGVKSI